MSISFINSAESNVSTGADASTVTCNKPTNTAQGDFMLAFFAGSTSGTPSADTGWTQVGTTQDGGSGVRSSVWRKVAGASEPSTYTFDGGVNNTIVCLHILTYRGVDTSDPIQTSNVATSGIVEALNSGNIVTTGITWVVSAGMAGDNANTVATNTTNGGSDAERTDSGIAPGGNVERDCCSYDSNADVTAGTYSRTITNTAPNIVGHAVWILALNEQPLFAPNPMGRMVVV